MPDPVSPPASGARDASRPGATATPAASSHSDARFRAIVDSAVDGVIVIDDRGRIESFNRAAERLFGYTEAEMLGQNVTALMPSPYREEHDSYIARYLQTGEPRIIGIGREVTGRRRDGTTFPVHLSVGEWQADGARHFTGILHDLSPRVRLEAQLREQSTLARLGQMATVIAHEVRNPLAAVRGAIQVIGGRLPKDSRDAPVVKDIVARLDALNDLIEELLLFARTPQPRLGSVALAPLLALTADLLAKDPAYADVRIEVEGEAPTIKGDRDLLQIAFQNLLINAAQAMQGRGAIRIGVSAGETGQVVRIADEGPGIAPDVLPEIFRPFFTTKARGTGLGLSIAQRIIEAHGGTLAIESPAGGGTTALATFSGLPPRAA
jgi:two-component system sensor kinase FixL